MTPAEIAQSLASAQGRPWWLWTDRHGRSRITPQLADAAGYAQLQRFTPADQFRRLPIQQSITSR